jgi:hypothetical protein
MWMIMWIIKRLFWLSALVCVAGISLAVTEPENVMAAPFRGMAIKTLEVGLSMVTAFRDARTVAATHEYSIIVNTLQVMQITDNVSKLPEVTTPTNDMSIFPSTAHPLYPDFIKSARSQFSYTIDSKGELFINKDEASIDPALKQFLETLNRLQKGETALLKNK